jgi:hypothetical protein
MSAPAVSIFLSHAQKQKHTRGNNMNELTIELAKELSTQLLRDLSNGGSIENWRKAAEILDKYNKQNEVTK